MGFTCWLCSKLAKTLQDNLSVRVPLSCALETGRKRRRNQQRDFPNMQDILLRPVHGVWLRLSPPGVALTKESTRHLPIRPADPAPDGGECGNTRGLMSPYPVAVFTLLWQVTTWTFLFLFWCFSITFRRFNSYHLLRRWSAGHVSHTCWCPHSHHVMACPTCSHSDVPCLT